ncbi:MAG: L,D-transpeptidase [Bacteroidetes bacterium]|nr:L,D-transpeptidase [Bacteroidota bacterium]
MRIGLFAFLFGSFFAACASGQAGDAAVPAVAVAAPVPVAVADVPLARLLDSLRLPAARLWLHVDKSERVMGVMVDTTELKRYPCVLGEHPVGDKMRQGDRRTPEGTFTFRSKRRHDKWHVFIWIDYPNAESWRRFKARQASGEVPANADIGGEVGIHGVPDGKDHWIDQGADWTWGCIALRNADVDEIYPYITPQRTRLVIEP